MGAVGLRGRRYTVCVPGPRWLPRVSSITSRGLSFVALPIVAPLGRFRGLGLPVGLVQVADLLLDSEGQALDWFYGLFPSCATQQRAERTR
jgi:hypothetical protein